MTDYLQLPNLNALICRLSSENSVLQQSTRVELLVATMKTIAAEGSEPLEEAKNWVFHRIKSQLPISPSSRSGDDFEGGSSMSSS